MLESFLQGLFVLISIFTGLGCLELTELVVPTHANLGHSVTLYCRFDLADARLYSVKWYKDEFEFFRFMPDNRPEIQVFPLAGMFVDVSGSDLNRVSLVDLKFNSSGVYRCEVSTEAPSFETRFKNGNMTVLAYPDRGPVISGTQAHYLPDDYITANCTSGQSNPAAQLHWTINGQLADPWLVEKSDPVVSSSVGPLFTSSMGLRFQAHKRYFERTPAEAGAGASLLLRCTARVADLPPAHADFRPHLSARLTNEKLHQPHSGHARQLPSAILVAILAAAIFSHCLLNLS